MHEGDWWDYPEYGEVINKKDELESQIIDEANNIFDFLDEFTAIYSEDGIPGDPASGILKLHEFSIRINDKILQWKKERRICKNKHKPSQKRGRAGADAV